MNVGTRDLCTSAIVFANFQHETFVQKSVSLFGHYICNQDCKCIQIGKRQLHRGNYIVTCAPALYLGVTNRYMAHLLVLQVWVQSVLFAEKNQPKPIFQFLHTMHTIFLWPNWQYISVFPISRFVIYLHLMAHFFFFCKKEQPIDLLLRSIENKASKIKMENSRLLRKKNESI